MRSKAKRNNNNKIIVKHLEEEANTRAHDNNPFVEVFQCDGEKKDEKRKTTINQMEIEIRF